MLRGRLRLTFGFFVLGLLVPACFPSGDRTSEIPPELPVEESVPLSPSGTASPAPQLLDIGDVPILGAGAPLGTPARLRLRPTGLTPIYAGYLQNPELAATLAMDLGGLWPGMTVLVEGAWASMAEGGSLSLFVPLGEGRTPRVAAAVRAAQPVDVFEMEQLIAPLGRFRAALGARFDLRFLSFELRVVFHDPGSGRSCMATGLSADSTGGKVAPCFSCLLAAGPETMCRVGNTWPARLSGSPEGLAQFAAALAN